MISEGNLRTNKDISITEAVNVVIDKIILFLFVNALLIDTINGIIIRKGLPSIGQPVRFLLFYLLMYRVFTLSLHGFVSFMIYYLLFMFMAFLHFFSNPEFGWFIADMAIVHKFIIIISVWIYVDIALKKKILKPKSIYRIFYFNLIVLAINLVLGIMGIGYSQYAGGIGSVGFFFAGNEVSGSMICLFAFVLVIVFNKYSLKKYFIFAFIILLLSFIKVTKVAIIGTMILVFMIPLIGMFMRYSLLSTKLLKFFVGVFFLLIVFFIIGYYTLDSIGLFNRIEYFYKVNSGDMLTLIMSGRNVFLKDAFMAFLNDYTFTEMLFGKGVEGALAATGKYYGDTKAVEIDLFDFLFQFGFVGVSLLILLILSFMRNSYKAYIKTLGLFPLIMLFTNILLLFISLIAGHIYNSAMAAIFIGILNGMVYYGFPEDIKK